MVDFNPRRYSMSIEKGNKINQLLQQGVKGGLYFSSWLKENGYSDQLLKQYKLSGWFSSLANGVSYRTGDSINSFAAFACYNKQVGKSFYIGAHSALELFGFNHYVPMGKPLLMIGHSSKEKISAWMKLDIFEHSLKFFSTEMFLQPQTTQIKVADVEITASVPEQAFLECLGLAPMQYSYMDLFYIMEQLTSLRPEIVQALLENTTNIKVKRLFLYMAKKAEHYWFKELNLSKIELGTGKQQLTQKGVFVSEFKITIPQELFEYE